jgi:folylpolyglutamate synthase/dihydropteroate synthase
LRGLSKSLTKPIQHVIFTTDPVKNNGIGLTDLSTYIKSQKADLDRYEKVWSEAHPNAHISQADSLDEAMRQIEKDYTSADILVTGSMFLVGVAIHNLKSST